MQVERFRERYLDESAKLLVDRLRMQTDGTGLHYRISDMATARAGIAEAERGPAVVALDDSELVGFMVAPLPAMPGAGGARITVEHHAASPPDARDAYRRMYEQIAGALVGAGCFDHSILVPIDQHTVLSSLFELQFGIDQIKGIRTLIGIDAPPSDTIRVAHVDDLERIVELWIELTQFHSRSPMLAAALVDVPRAGRPPLDTSLRMTASCSWRAMATRSWG